MDGWSAKQFVVSLSLAKTIIFEVNRQPPSTESRSKQAQTTPARTAQSKQTPTDEYPQQSLKTQSREAATRAYIENVRRDPQYEWKMPIRFYGKVIDQYGSPVVRASVCLQWVTLKGTEGVSAAKTTTDAKGLFALENATGKTLSVKITKEGYYDVSRRENQTSFEYANPAETIFYEPNDNSPAIFLMRKRATRSLCS